MDTMTNRETAPPLLRAPADAAEWRQVHALRRDALFDDTMAYDPDHPDDRSPDHRVFVLSVAGEVIGTLRVDLSHPVWAAMRLVAIDPARRRRGYGAAMMRLAETFVKDKGWRQVRLHAKPDAIGFYRRCGYHDVHWDEVPRDPLSVNMGKHL